MVFNKTNSLALSIHRWIGNEVSDILQAEEFFKGIKRQVVSNANMESICWDPPAESKIKHNCDGTVASDGSAAYGRVLRNNASEVILLLCL